MFVVGLRVNVPAVPFVQLVTARSTFSAVLFVRLVVALPVELTTTLPTATGSGVTETAAPASRESETMKKTTDSSTQRLVAMNSSCERAGVPHSTARANPIVHRRLAAG
jgi:hypothetical protein